ncbi:cytochrome P450 94B3-like [Wolffia australiana]
MGSSSSAMFLAPFLPFIFMFVAGLNFAVRLILGGRRRKLDIQEHGPRGYPLVGCLVSFNKNKRRLLDWYTELLAESPSQTIVVARLGARRTVVTGNPENVEHILKTRFENYPKGRPFSELLGDLLGTGIFNADGKLWRTQRKLVSHEFSARMGKAAAETALATAVGGRLVPALAAAADGSAVVDLQELLRWLAFDTICMVSMGIDPSCLGSEGGDASCWGVDLAEAFDAAAGICARRGTAPVQAVWKTKRALGIGSERILREKLAVINDAVGKLIKHRKTEKNEKQTQQTDFLSRLLSAGHSDTAVRDMVVSFIMAGRDTTSSALTWFFWVLSQHPEAEARAADEAATAKGELSYGALKEMTWLEACLCESMRLYPPVAWDSKHAAEDDVLPDGTRVFKGDRVTYFPYGMGRMERLWGKDAEEFRPSRWLDAEEMEMVKVSPFKYPVFQAGPRVCLGKDMAFVQMKYVSVSVLKKFSLRPVSAVRPVFLPLLTSHMAGGLNVSVTGRKPTSASI